MLYVRNATGKPMRFSFDVVPYFAEFGLDLFIFDSTIEFGEGLQNGLDFHDKMMSRGTLLVEFPANGPAIDKDFFFIMALPLKIKGLDSSWCRLIGIVEK
jgi:kynurenine formamidase